MAESRFDPNPASLAALAAQLDKVPIAAADEGALVLYENLDESTSIRTGEFYAGQKRRSSTSKEFSQKQEGTLQGMADSGPLGPGEAWFGYNPENADQLGQAKGQELGNDETSLVGRANLRRTAMDSRTHRRMNEAVMKAVK
jgi:hypothetical protein